MPSTVEQLSPSRVKITIEVPFANLQPSLDKAYAQIAQRVNIPGFRKGKVPSAIIDQRFGRGTVLQEAINDALPGEYSKAVSEHELNPLAQPEIEVTKLEDGDLVEFTADVVVRPDFELPDFSTISATVDPVTVDDALVDERIDLLRQRVGEQVEVDRPAATGDIVTIDLLGSKGGEQLSEASADGVQYKIGTEGMLDGLDEAVMGLSVGDSAEFRSTLVGGPLRGEEADIEVTVRKVAQQQLPELDDEFAKSISDFETFDQMRADLRSAAEQSARLDQAAQAQDRVLEAIIADLDLEVPESLLADEIKARHAQITDQLAQAGQTLDSYLANADEERTAEEFWADMDGRIAQALKSQLVLDKAAEELQIGVDPDDLTQQLIQRAQRNGTSPEAEAQHMMEHDHAGEWMSEIRRSKALAHLVNAASVTEPDGTEVDFSRLRPDGTIAAETADGDESDSADVGESDSVADAGPDVGAASKQD